MDELKQLLEEQLNRDLVQIVISSPRNGQDGSKIRIRPVLLKGELCFQTEQRLGPKVFHENWQAHDLTGRILDWMGTSFKQLQLEGAGVTATALVSKKGKVTIKKKQRQGCVKQLQLEHNRKKRYILEEGKPVAFLVDLGVMTPEGRVVHARYDKFRQINRFLEFIQDVLPELPRDREISILDFGCGKSYLTFAMYEYLRVLHGLDVRIIGLDLKEDVITRCNELSKKYGYDKLHFWLGDVANYEDVSHVDMVVTLHACDTATDYALYKAVKWGAKVILSVPCCQHELNGQMKNEILQPVLRYGLLKERMAALITDGLRAELLTQQGYETQILEFIDMEHTPKNILIRAVKRGRRTDGNREEYEQCARFLHVSGTLERLLCQEAGDFAMEAEQMKEEVAKSPLCPGPESCGAGTERICNPKRMEGLQHAEDGKEAQPD
ncbi:MAG: SAM-dependent methyltransferase [Lachnospiraceae bacterium]|nr:SAM-dependent methyltransferase [Lachnospiraceae bacterium]